MKYIVVAMRPSVFLHFLRATPRNRLSHRAPPFHEHITVVCQSLSSLRRARDRYDGPTAADGRTAIVLVVDHQ
jgi:hypothetical protein